MKKLVLLTATFLFCCFFSFSQEHLMLQKKAAELFSQQKFEEALNTCEKALRFAEENVGKEHLEYVQVLNDLGNYKIVQSDLVGGIKDLLTAEIIIQKVSVEKSSSNIKLLNDIAFAYMEAGMNEDAGKYFQKALDYKKELNAGDDLEYAIILGSLAEVQRTMANYKEAELNLLKSKKIFDDNGMKNSSDYGSLLNNIASFYHDQANYIIAEKYYKNAANTFLKTDGEFSENYANCMQNCGELYADIGAYDDAGKCFFKAREVKAKVMGEESYSYSTILNNLAYLYHHTGEYAKSEEAYLQTLQLKKKLLGENHDSYLRTKQNLAMLYANLGRIKSAEKMLEEVVAKVAPNKKEDPLIYTGYSENLGCIYTGNKKFIPAEKLLKEALESYKTIFGENHPEYIRALNNLAFLYNEKGDINDAKKYYELAVNTCEKENTCGPQELMASYNSLAAIYKNEEKIQRSFEYISKSVEISGKKLNANHPGYLNTLFLQAGIYANMGKYKEADALYSQVLDKYIERLNKDVAFMTEAEKGEFLEDLNFKMDNYFSFAFSADLKDGAFADKIVDYRLATKALLLNSQRNIKEIVAQRNDSSLLQTYSDFKKINNYLARLYSFSHEEILASGINIDSLEIQRAQLEKTISSVLTEYKNEKITWKNIQHKLGKDEVAIEIIRSESSTVDGVSYGVLLITKTDPKPFLFFVPKGNELESTAIAEYRKNIRSRMVDTVSFAKFFEKIYKVAGPVKKIYFSGDGIYNQVNINTLLNPQTGNYMLHDYDICLLTNLKDMLELKEKKEAIPQNSYAALFGFPDYGMALTPAANNFNGENLLASRAGARGKWTLNDLPGTKTEVEEIGKIFNANNLNAKLFLAEKSDETTLKKIKNPYVLHIATHGFFESDIPKTSNSREVPDALKRAAENPLLRSGVMLAGANNSYSASYNDVSSWESYEDGILTAYEVMNLGLDSTSLVVLSACQTGLGEIKNGEGVYGLQRAFLVAGAQSVIMSLWSVSDDATRDLMILFYEKWLSTGDKRNAFNEAQRELMKKYPQPYYWGAFVLIEK